MADNDKTNPALGTSPNENYAREVLQLFSIGLYELNPDGSQKLDGSGAPIPTYDQDVIEGFSAVFTGWTYAPLAGAASQWTNPINYDGVMVAFDNHHEPGTKLLLERFTRAGGTAQRPRISRSRWTPYSIIQTSARSSASSSSSIWLPAIRVPPTSRGSPQCSRTMAKAFAATWARSSRRS